MRPNELLAKELEELISQDNWSKNEVLLIMLKFRQFMELFTGMTKELKYLNLYCNWALHVKIDRQEPIYEVLEYLTDSIIKNVQNPGNEKEFAHAVIEGLSLHKVYNDITVIGNGGFGIPSIVEKLNFERWKSFANLLIENIYDRPTSFPKPVVGRARSYYNSIQRKLNTLVENDGSYGIIGIEYKFIGPDGEDPKQRVLVTTMNKITLMFEVEFINQQMIDDYDKMIRIRKRMNEN